MKIKLKNLNENRAILEIRNVNPLFVSRYRQAMRGGSKFPPIIIDRKTKQVVSGYHRRDAYSLEYGKDHIIEVIAKTYANEAEKIEEAIRENITHGNPLDGISRRRAALKLAELGRDAEAISRLLGVSVNRVEKMGHQTVVVRGTIKPVKRGLENMHGMNVTTAQYKEHIQADRGIPALSSIKQLTRWFINGWVSTDEKTLEAVIELQSQIELYTK
jgi:hypothetical protein